MDDNNNDTCYKITDIIVEKSFGKNMEVEDGDDGFKVVIEETTTGNKWSTFDAALGTMIAEMDNNDKYFATTPTATESKKDGGNLEIKEVDDDSRYLDYGI